MIHRKDIFSVNINENKVFFSKLANETPYSRFQYGKIIQKTL